jgi:hypothetical protein
MIFKSLKTLLLYVILGFLMVACSGGGGDGKTGTVSVSLTDASTLYNAVVLNIDKVGVVTNKSGVTYYNSDNIGELPISINVLDLPNEATMFLGDIEVPLPEDGSEVCIQQIRLVLANEGNYVILKGDDPLDPLNRHALKTPSGQQSGEKILVKEETFCLSAQDDAVNVTLDFDPDTAITVNQNSANPYQFKPTAMRIIEGNFFEAPAGYIQGEVKVPTPKNADGSCEIVPNPIVTVESYFDSPVLTSKTVALTDGPIVEGDSCYYLGGFKLLLPDNETYDLKATWGNYSATATAAGTNTTDLVLELKQTVTP